MENPLLHHLGWKGNAFCRKKWLRAVSRREVFRTTPGYRAAQEHCFFLCPFLSVSQHTLFVSTLTVLQQRDSLLGQRFLREEGHADLEKWRSAERREGQKKKTTSKDNKKVSESAKKNGGIWDTLQVFVKELKKTVVPPVSSNQCQRRWLPISRHSRVTSNCNQLQRVTEVGRGGRPTGKVSALFLCKCLCKSIHFVL